jgi:hypothetical protein
MATGSDRRSRDAVMAPLSVRMRNQMLRNIHPSGAFWPEMTSSNVTHRDVLEVTWSDVPLGSSLGRLHPIIVF